MNKRAKDHRLRGWFRNLVDPRKAKPKRTLLIGGDAGSRKMIGKKPWRIERRHLIVSKRSCWPVKKRFLNTKRLPNRANRSKSRAWKKSGWQLLKNGPI